MKHSFSILESTLCSPANACYGPELNHFVDLNPHKNPSLDRNCHYPSLTDEETGLKSREGTCPGS